MAHSISRKIKTLSKKFVNCNIFYFILKVNYSYRTLGFPGSSLNQIFLLWTFTHYISCKRARCCQQRIRNIFRWSALWSRWQKVLVFVTLNDFHTTFDDFTAIPLARRCIYRVVQSEPTSLPMCRKKEKGKRTRKDRRDWQLENNCGRGSAFSTCIKVLKWKFKSVVGKC